MYNNCAETHLGGGVINKSPFVSLSAIARAHDPTVIGSVALRKDSVHIVVIAVKH